MATAAAPAFAKAATPLFPNLIALPASEIHFDQVVYADATTHNVVRFSQATENVGEGPFDLRGLIAGTNEVYQRLYNSDGTYTDMPVQADFIYHPTHHHFHFPDYARYELWTKASWDAYAASGYTGPQQPLVTGGKVSFCITDTGAPDTLVANYATNPVYNLCDQSSQGLSVGWHDTYKSNVDGQWLDLGVVQQGQPALPDGDYVIRSIVDPDGLIYESTGMSNAARESVTANQATASFTVDNTPKPDPCTQPGTNPIVCENSKPGADPTQWQTGAAGDPTIAGFTTDISTNVGGTVDFKVKTDAANYQIKIYRLGYYQGNGARFVDTVIPSAALPQTQPNCLGDAATGLTDCGNWAVSASWSVPADAVSGVYAADLVRSDTGGTSQILFIVRNDASHSDVLFQTNDADWQAYNTWNGTKSYYRPDTSTRADKVSYNRPLNTRATEPLSYFFNGEYPMVRFLERNGYDVSYFTDIDANRLPALIQNHKAFVISGHSEYWSGAARQAVANARDAGVNLALFAGNEMFWKTRFENSLDASSTPYRTMVSYKESLDNRRTDPSGIWTGEWRDMRFTNAASNTPENALSGTLFTTNAYAESSILVDPSYGKARFWRDTTIGLASGPVALTQGVLGYEWDSDIDNGYRPAGLFDVSSTTEAVSDKYDVNGFDIGPGTATHNMTEYKAPSGALVFSSGTIQWAWGLDSTHDVKSSVAQQPADQFVQQATVNILADMNAQGQTLMASLEPETASTDTTAPHTTISAPASNASIAQGSPVTVSGTAVDSGGGVVTAVEVSTDSGATWHPATGLTGATMSFSYTWTPPLGPVSSTTIKARAVDDSGNLESTPAAVPVTVTTRACPCYAFSATAVPDQVASTDTSSIEVGVKFRTDVAGYISGVRFYKGAGNGGQHTGSLWSSTGALLARASFTGETASGWQQVNFDAPVAVSANTTYLASYFAPQGRYAVTRPFFTAAVDNPPVHLLKDGVDGGNGMFLYASSPAFPTQTSNAGNYWVDPVFVTQVAADTTAPTVAATTPVAAATQVDARIAPTVQFSEAMTASSISSSTITLTGPNNAVVPATVSYSSTLRTATLTPTSSLAYSTSYTLTVKSGSTGVKDLAGNALAQAYAVSFTTAAVVCPCTIWPSTTVPGTPASSDGSSVELGVKFRTDLAGYISGIKFYKGAGNTGTHVGSLWSSTGTLLARATFSGESTTGWQTVSFANPVQVAADTTYIASYYAPVGHYSLDRPFFTSTISSSPLRALADGFDGGNGLYQYTGSPTFPKNSSTSANYWVDVVFSTTAPLDTTPPNVASVAPANATTGVDPRLNAITATFDEGMTAASLTSSSFTLSAGGSSVPATVSYDAASRTATLTPQSTLQWGATYTAQLLGGSTGVKDLAGNPIAAAYSWSFTTQACPCSIFKASQTPDQTSTADSGSLELGVKFQSSVAGFVTGIRFYKGTGNSGTHVGSLWTATGTLLSRATFVGESASGWQTVTFDAPVSINANTTYVASYFAPNGHYALTRPGLGTAIVNAPLTALADGSAGGNGLFQYSASPIFPTSTSGSGNYWVDVVFATAAPPDTTAPQVAATSPSGGSTGADPSAPVTVSFNKAMTASTISASTIKMTGPGSTAVPGAVTYNATTRTATFTPSAALAINAQYTVNVIGGSGGVKDSAGNALASTYTFSYTTAGISCPCSLFSTATTPGTPSASDTSAVELGMRFRSDVAGYITGVRFYKGPANTGVHVGSLWTNNGIQLAQVTFTNETATGWQVAKFSTPVQVTANTTYVVAYYAPKGGYSVDRPFFTSQVTALPLRGLADGFDGANGLYLYGTSPVFPTNTANSANYYVDVVFDTSAPAPAPDTTPPTVVTTAPASGATGADPSAPITVGFSEPMTAATITAANITLTNASNQAVPASVAYNATSQVATLTPSAALAYNVAYTVKVTGVTDTAGNAIAAPYSFTFTTATLACPCSLWPSTAVPANPSASDTSAVELGLKFRSDIAGSITAIRFYKGAANTGTHVGSLWSATGTLLAQVTFTGETASGWQQANLSAPVQIAANTTYIVGYYAPNGGYASDRPFFTNALNAPPLHALADGFDGVNGLYLYSPTPVVPTNGAGAANYWVDVVFTSP